MSVNVAVVSTVLTTCCYRDAYHKKQGSFLANGSALAESEACVVMAEACLCLAAAVGPQLGTSNSADLEPNAQYAMHVSCLKHHELVDCFHKAHVA